jgi:hypothetical protein
VFIGGAFMWIFYVNRFGLQYELPLFPIDLAAKVIILLNSQNKKVVFAA